MEGKKNCGNGNVEMQGKKMWQLICGNEVAENEGKNFFVAAKFRNWRKEDLG